MSGIKTFPIVMTIEDHKKIKDAAAKLDIPISKLFMIAVNEKIKREGE